MTVAKPPVSQVAEARSVRCDVNLGAKRARSTCYASAMQGGSGVELRQLRYFVSLTEEMHFGRAAEREHIAQPAFSQQIRRLERELGVQLFNRTSRRVELTEPGRVFVGQARSILEAANDAIALVQHVGVGKQGRLRVAYSNRSDRGVPGLRT